jgi:steroid 5-alpha reductase family enzyme
MNEQTAKLLEDLAAKLQVSSAHLWEVLVTQAFVSSVTSLAVLAALSIAAYNVRKHIKSLGSIDDMSGLDFAALSVACVIYAIYLVGFMISLDSIVAGLINPEYTALKEVLSVLK